MADSLLPYSFAVIKSGKDFEYQVTKYPSPVVLAGGISRSRRDAEKHARLEISKLRNQS